MSSTQKTEGLPDLTIAGLSLEDACDMIEDMKEVHRNDTGGLMVWSGRSQKFGLVHIIQQPSGDAIVLPWIQQVITTDNQDPLETHSTAN